MEVNKAPQSAKYAPMSVRSEFLSNIIQILISMIFIM